MIVNIYLILAIVTSVIKQGNPREVTISMRMRLLTVKYFLGDPVKGPPQMYHRYLREVNSDVPSVCRSE